MRRLAPLPPDAAREPNESFARYRQVLGFVPNSARIMQRKPKLLEAVSKLNAAVWDPQGEVTIGFRRLVGYVASKAHGCQY